MRLRKGSEMSYYVVYESNSTKIVARASTLHGAKIARGRFLKSGEAERRGYGIDNDFSIADSKTFHNYIEKYVERTNLMSGKKFMERVNTPNYCSPASESYWSM